MTRPRIPAEILARPRLVGDKTLDGVRVEAPGSIPCPSCGGELVIDYVLTKRSAAEAYSKTGMWGRPDGFGLVEALVPWAVCETCDFTADGSEEPPGGAA